jgi:peroxisomal 2,4-dienoyl-CoA reductase
VWWGYDSFLATAEGLSPKGFQTVLDIDTVGVFNMCHAAFPHLKRAGAGGKGDALIINISACLHYGAVTSCVVYP